MSLLPTGCSMGPEGLPRHWSRCALPPRLFIVTRNAQPCQRAIGPTRPMPSCGGWAARSPWNIPKSGAASSISTTRCRRCWPRGMCCAKPRADDGEDQVVYRAGVRHVPRLERRNPPPRPAGVLGDDTSHLVIGATGNIGPHLIRQLADMGAATIVAVSRNPGSRLDELAQRLASTGTTLVEVAADAADEAAMTALFDRFGDRSSRPRGHLPRGLRRRPGDVARHDRRRREHDVPPEAGRRVAAAQLSLRTHCAPVRAVLVDIRHPRFPVARSLRRDHHLPRHFRATPAAALGLPATVVNWGVWKSLADSKTDARQVTSDSGLEPMPDEVAIRALGVGDGSRRARAV